MTSRRDAVRALAGISALPFFRALGAEELIEVGRRAHTLAELDSSATPRSLRALTAAEYEIVTQAAERIIPRTATPGATDARVADFVDVMLADWYNDSERERFKSGLRELDGRTQNLSKGSLSKTPARQQSELLETLDRELQLRRESGVAGADDHWFAMLKYLTIWGYYTSRPGIVEELRVDVLPGRYDGNAPY
jgi:hypothetical protein